jgi:L-histidine N-alpha-methyltransferase
MICTKTRPRFELVTMDATARLSAFARDVAAGLGSEPRQLHCCYFYDQEGSALFEEICTLPEYYLTRCEEQILRRVSGAIAGRFDDTPVTLVELGSGNAAKTRLLIAALLHRQERLRYVPIDICRTVLEDSARDLLKDYPGLDILAVAGEYQEGMRFLKDEGDGPRLILWLGSNVGNFHRDEAAQFLAAVRATMQPDDRLLAGIDLRKDRAILEPAYDDPRGVTARFNLNLLTRINRELGGHFDLSGFRHRAVYNEPVGRIEMYLDSVRGQEVRIDRLAHSYRFNPGEPVHTENSYKYSFAEIDSLAASAGLRVEERWTDEARRYSLNFMAAA